MKAVSQPRLMHAIVAFCFVFASFAQANTATLTSTKDNTLYQSSTGNLSNGIGRNLYAGVNGGGEIRRALVQFDLTSIPSGSVVNSVTLQMTVNQTSSGPNNFEVHRVLASWGEGTSNSTVMGGGMGAAATTNDATWLHRFYNTVFWTNPGGDYAAAISTVKSINGTGTYTWPTSPTFVSDVQGWVNSPAGNFGLIVIGVETAPSTTKRFGSREFGTASQRPMLIVDYSSSPPPSVTLILKPLRDNTLYQSNDGSVSNGRGPTFFVGRNGGGTIQRGLLAFDIAGRVIPGATIQSASLLLNMSQTNAGPANVSIHRVTASWGEGASTAPANGGAGVGAQSGDATWLHRFYDTTFWTNAGGDFNPTASASLSVGEPASYEWTSTPQLVADVQGWLGSSATDFGWLVRGDESAPSTSKRFDSREASEPDQPKLTLVITPPCRLGDVNGDSAVNFNDVMPFIGVVLNPLNATAAQRCAANANADAVVDGADISAMVRLILASP